MDQWGRKEHPEVNLQIYDKLIFDKNVDAI